MSKVWLITGSGSGLGRVIAEAALAAGNEVVATARNPAQLSDLVDRYGARVRAFRLDVTIEEEAMAAVQTAVDTFGRLDVLINNAGYGDLRPFEQTPSEDVRQVIETCLYGVINLTRAALPVMRRQRSGHIIQISSAGGRTAFPVGASYYAAKWGVGGFTEGIALEAAPFGVKATTLEPGAMRTNWGKRATEKSHDVWPDYQPSVGATIKAMEGFWGNETGDPVKVAQVVLKVADAEVLPPHIILGGDVLHGIRAAEKARADAADRWEAVSNSTNFDATGPIPPLPSN
jgi:NAD(P)-dependent dehydrogenase (short-subunit alcohol dehydrogenase family)